MTEEEALLFVVERRSHLEWVMAEAARRLPPGIRLTASDGESGIDVYCAPPLTEEQRTRFDAWLEAELVDVAYPAY